MTHLEQSWHLWLPVQAVRDFAAQAEHQLTRPAPALQSQWEHGLRSFLQDFGSHRWKQECHEEEDSERQSLQKAGPAEDWQAARMSSHDLLVCLDNALRGVGLALASFVRSSGPQ